MSGIGRSRDRDREPSKRNSITDRLVNTFNQVRNRDPSSPLSPLGRRASSASSTSGPSPIAKVREWLDTCNREHDHHCSISNPADDPDPTASTVFRPEWLIDSSERCLVRSQPGDRYVALSYVWGMGPNQRKSEPEESAKLLKSNIEMYRDGLPERDVPDTIYDAIRLSRKLGLKYIWVDRLCIVQDDEVQKEAHVRHMADIFAGAYLTIVAAHGDAETGLVQLDPRRPPPARGGGFRPQGQSHDELVLKSRWHSRGWTLQEYMYSRRCVFFFEDTITWECHCDLWENTPPSILKAIQRKPTPACTIAPAEAILGYRHTTWPDLDEYARIAMEYSARKVTVPEDALRAFAGITHMLSRVYPGGFIYGMPLMFLDVALLWRPQASIRRRAVMKPPFLPSWSWMGWWFDGVPADMILWRAAADYVHDTLAWGKGGTAPKRLQPTSGFKFKSTVTWSLTDRQASVPVANTGLQYRDLRARKTPATVLPAGWSKSGSHYFKYDGDPDTTFKYPVPVEDLPEQGTYEPPVGELAYPGPLLSFRSKTAFFEVDYSESLAPRDADCPPVAVGNIWTKSNRWAGTFRAHDGWLGVQSSNYGRDQDEMLEFVAISTVIERRGSHLFSEEQFQANRDVEEYIYVVNVLWIERIGGIAYRRGLGHILEKAWDAQHKEEGEILLG